jgi:hypothetical protein
MQPIILSSKFKPFILNNECQISVEKDLFTMLERIFNHLKNPYNPLSVDNGFKILGGKAHVVEHSKLPNWIIKGERNDSYRFNMTPDTHIYRVRRAEKQRKLGLKEYVIPEKYLYQYKRKWFVIARKLELDPTKTLDPSKTSLQHVQLSPAQAEEGALMCYKGKWEDVGAHNISFTRDGKLALIDTEPVGRKQLKEIAKSIVRFWPLYKATALHEGAQVSSERLHDLTLDPLASCRIRKVQNTMCLIHLAKLIAWVAWPILAILGILFFRLPINRFAIMAAGVGAAVNAIFGAYLIVGTIYMHFSLRSPKARKLRDLAKK